MNLGHKFDIVDQKIADWIQTSKAWLDAGYLNKTVKGQWNDDWKKSMGSKSSVFAFLLPAWGIDFVLRPNWDGDMGAWGVTNPPTEYNWGGSYVHGCVGFKKFWYITLPLIRPILAYTMITAIIGGLQMYDVPQILTNGQGTPDRTSTKGNNIYLHSTKEHPSIISRLSSQNMQDVEPMCGRLTGKRFQAAASQRVLLHSRSTRPGGKTEWR